MAFRFEVASIFPGYKEHIDQKFGLQSVEKLQGTLAIELPTSTEVLLSNNCLPKIFEQVMFLRVAGAFRPKYFYILLPELREELGTKTQANLYAFNYLLPALVGPFSEAWDGVNDYHSVWRLLCELE